MISAILLLVIYLAFIGLGLPDSLFGAAWPAIYTEWGLPISTASFVTCLTSGSTVISTLLAAKAISRFGTGKVTAFSTALTAVALLGFRFSPNILWMCVFAIPLGLGAGAVDTALNHYVALHYKASHMNFLHGFYGIGIAITPWLMSMALSGMGGWRGGYSLVVILQSAIALVTILALPLWKKAAGAVEAEKTEKPVPFRELLRRRKVRLSCYILTASCAMEFTCGVWGSTFLVEWKGLPADRAAGLITFYYVGIAVSRLVCGFLADRLGRRRIIRLGETILVFAILVIALPLSPGVAGVGLFLVGLGNGPLYPNLMHLAPDLFGADNSQSVMGLQMASAYGIGILLTPVVFGYLAQGLGLWVFAPFLGVWLLFMGGSTFLLLRKNTPNQG